MTHWVCKNCGHKNPVYGAMHGKAHTSPWCGQCSFSSQYVPLKNLDEKGINQK